MKIHYKVNVGSLGKTQCKNDATIMVGSIACKQCIYCKDINWDEKWTDCIRNDTQEFEL